MDENLKPLTSDELNTMWEIQNCSNYRLLRGTFDGEDAAYIVFIADGDIYPVAKLLSPGDYPKIKGPPGLEALEI